jgi:FK506-binding nuclear protein
MFFGHHLKLGSRLKVKDACEEGADVLTLTSICLSGDGAGSLLVHTPDGQKLSVARLGAATRFARVDVQLDAATPGFSFEALGCELDIAGFSEPHDIAAAADASATKQIAKAEKVQNAPAQKAAEEKKAAEAKKTAEAKKDAEAKAAAEEKAAKARQVQKEAAEHAAALMAKVKKSEDKKAGQGSSPEETTNGTAAAAAAQVKDFIQSNKFIGAKPGMVFKKGKQGLGYYKDTYAAPKGAKRKADAEPQEAPPAKQVGQLRGGLKFEVVKNGNRGGQKATRGRVVQVKYEGRLASNGRRFDKGVIKFKLGAGEVIQGWDIGVDNMMTGEVRKLLIPPALGYGRGGAPPDIPPNAALAFEVELLRVG